VKDRSFSPLTALHSNLMRLLAIRAIVSICQWLALGYAWAALALPLIYWAIALILGLSLVLNLLVWWRLHHTWAVTESEFAGHLLLDMLVLSLLLYLTGGANNPFVSYLLVPVIIAAAALSRGYTLAVAGTGVACYTLLLFFFEPLPQLSPGLTDSITASHDLHEHSAPAADNGLVNALNLHVAGMWVNFLVSAGLITWFVTRMAGEIRHQDAQLARLREESLRDEQIMSVAIQAAGTAHELGTPLNTMAIVLGEMEQEHANNLAALKDVSLLQRQVRQCKESLRRLVNEADYGKAAHGQWQPLKVLVEEILDRWRLLRPEVKLELTEPVIAPAPWVRLDGSLRQAMLNLLDNAADVSPSRIDMRLFWSTSTWGMVIRDYGPGLPPELQEKAGMGLFSNKPGGMGVGLMLSQASINRLGGSVTLQNHPEGGTVTTVSMPLQQMENT
jgi:two-component system, sensor histidine kinase RegB